MRPSRSQTHNWFESGTAVSPTAFVKSKFGNATIADQFPEMVGAVSGIEPLRNALTCARESSPKDFAFAEKMKLPKTAKIKIHRRFLKNCIVVKNPDKILCCGRAVNFLLLFTCKIFAAQVFRWKL